MHAEKRILSSDLPTLGLAPLEILQKVFDQHAIISVADVTGTITYANDKFCEVSGYSRDELLGANHRIIKSDAHSPKFFRDMWRTIAQGGTWQGPVQNRRKDGSPYWVQTTIVPVFGDDGKPEQYISIRTDITQQVLSQRELSKFKQLLDQTLDSVFIFSADSLSITYVNLGAVEQVGFTEHELLAMSPVDIKPDIDEQQFRTMLEPLLNSEVDSLTFETFHQHKSGQRVPVEIFLQFFSEPDSAGQFIAIVRDVTERKRTVEALEALTVADPTKNVFHSIACSVADALDARWVGVGKLTDSGDGVQLMGLWSDGHEGELFSFPLEGTPCEDICSQGQSLLVPDQVLASYPDSHMLRDIGAVSYRGDPLLNNEGSEIGVLFVIDDKPCQEVATERALMRVAAKRAALEIQRLQAEQVAQSQSRQLYETLERVSDGFFSLNESWCFTYLNPSAAKIFGVAWDALKGQCLVSIMPEVYDYLQPHFQQAMQEQKRVWISEFKPFDRSLSLYVYPSPQGVSVYMQDVTEYQRLRSEHRRLERQVQQSQKMEAIGQLTAGIAHDFNNILASINGYTDLALTRCVDEGQDQLRGYLEHVYKAGERARDLIQQMTAYSHSTTAKETALSLRPLLKEMLKMLRSTLPTSIQLSFDCPTDEEIFINMDAAQLQQIVMNLCVNARDAMHGAGQLELRLECTEQQPVECASCHNTLHGDYVVLSVRDSGDGMMAEVRDHLFEPFFTTKDVGEGTGLGLSVAHGIMHDHQGHIRVESEPGQGTVFYLLFPALKN
jgi:PAS domain S-box-containing protein